MYKLFQSLLDFIYPRTCLLCNNNTEEIPFLCSFCYHKLVHSVKVSSQRGSEDFPHLAGDIFFDRVVTCWDYNPEMELLIHRVKYQRGMKLGIFLGNVVGDFVKECFQDRGDAIMIPVPLHKVRYRERGYNQSRLISRGVNAYIPLEICHDNLIRARNTSSQTGLNASERQRNVEGAFRVKKLDGVVGKKVLLIDDVTTTGATVNSCAACLKEAGALEVVVLALARPLMR